MKPWARYEVGFIDHPKFKALNANAIGLWIEGKNYCDRNMTDGLIPTHTVKQFRFYSRKAVDSLMVSCGPKNEQEVYAPLWEVHALGYKMHDYLDHNDCRQAVIARIEKSEDRAEQAKVRVRNWRERQKNAPVSQDVTRNVRDANAPVTQQTEAVPESQSESSKPKEQVSRVIPPARPTLIARRRLDAAFEGPRGMYVPQRQHDQFVASRNGNEPEVLKFYETVADEWGYGARRESNIDPDMFRFWTARFAEQWPPEPVAKRNAGPVWAQ